MSAQITQSSLEECFARITRGMDEQRKSIYTRGMDEQRKSIYNFVFETVTDVISEYCSEEENDQSIRDWFGDLLSEGCSSGVVGRLIYNSDCRAWIDSAPVAFEEMFNEILEDAHSRHKTPADVFPDWCFWSGGHGLENANIIAWAVFERVGRDIASHLGIDE